MQLYRMSKMVRVLVGSHWEAVTVAATMQMGLEMVLPGTVVDRGEAAERAIDLIQLGGVR